MILIRCLEADRKALGEVKFDPQEIAEDGTNYYGIRIKKPWGHEVEKYRDENCSVWWLHLHSGKETSMHCHPNKTTMLMVVGGEAMLHTLNGRYELGEGEIAVIEKGAFHRTASNGGPVVLYEIESPPNKRDLVRLEDSYGRGQGYERVVS